ncbi:MAG: Tm-1-like ATP-binding domain-containing protein [candidate division NC10 bacterium]
MSTLDTKGPETAYLAERIRQGGLEVLVVDCGVLGEPLGITPDISHERVAEAAGSTLGAVRSIGTRGAAVEIMARGLSRILVDLHADGRCGGVVALGGAEGAVMAAQAMQALPLGVPKLIVTPVAAGRRTFGPFVGLRDVMLMHSVVDILGLNSVSRAIFDNAAGAISGMARAARPAEAGRERLVGITMLGNTTPAVMRIAAGLEAAGLTPLIFHSNGVGGPCMEEMIAQGRLVGVIDFTTNELTDELVGGIYAAGPDRLEAAARHGVPQVVVPGCADFFVAGPRESVPPQWRARPQYHHNPVFTLIRASREEMAAVGRIMAAKLGASRGPVAVAVPLGGLSIPNTPGGVFHDPEADAAFLAALRRDLRRDIPVVEVPAHINAPRFAETVLDLFLRFVPAPAAGGRVVAEPRDA